MGEADADVGVGLLRVGGSYAPEFPGLVLAAGTLAGCDQVSKHAQQYHRRNTTAARVPNPAA